jgi:hypothetical protein
LRQLGSEELDNTELILAREFVECGYQFGQFHVDSLLRNRTIANRAWWATGNPVVVVVAHFTLQDEFIRVHPRLTKNFNMDAPHSWLLKRTGVWRHENHRASLLDGTSGAPGGDQPEDSDGFKKNHSI